MEGAFTKTPARKEHAQLGRLRVGQGKVRA